MKLEQLLYSLAKPGDTVLDVGAFRGDVSLLFASRVAPTGKVFSFEPNPVDFLYLSVKAAGLGEDSCINPFCKAMSDREGHVVLATCKDFDDKEHQQRSSIIPSYATTERFGDNFLRIKVETESIDSVCDRFRLAPALIKIDTEGAEPMVIKGASRTLSSISPKVVFECGINYPGNLPPTHLEELARLGYMLFIVDIMHFKDAWLGEDILQGSVLPVSVEEVLSFDKTLTCNILALHYKGVQESLKEIKVLNSSLTML